MNVLGIIAHYLHWHYTKAFGEIFGLWRNILWSIKEFFSFALLLKTFFSPWKRLHEKGSGGVGGFFEGLIVTSIMRIVGMGMRTIVLFVGAIVMLGAFFGGLIFLGLWPIFPILLLATGMSGVWAIIKYT